MYKKRMEIILMILDNHRYLQKRSTLLQNNDDCLNAIKTLIGKIDNICIFFSNEQDYYKNVSQSFTICFFFSSNSCAVSSMTLLRNFLNST